MTRPAKTALALGKIDLEEKTTDLRLKLKGKLAVDLADYQRAFAQANDQSLELDQLVTSSRPSSTQTKASRPGASRSPPHHSGSAAASLNRWGRGVRAPQALAR